MAKMNSEELGKLARDLKPYLAGWFGYNAAAAAASGANNNVLTAHALNSSYHTGQLAQSQAPWAVTDDEFAIHSADVNAHHARVHAITSTSDHTASGLTTGHVLRATGATTFAWQQLGHGDLGGVTANQHHNQVHGIVSSDHTVTGSALDVIGLSGSNTLGVLTPSSNPAGTSKILKSAADGSITLQSATINESFYAAATAFRIINHTHDYPHAHVVINPGVSWTLDEQFGLDIDDNLLVRGWIVGKHAIQLAGALMIAHYDGPEPYATNFKGEPNGHMGQVAAVSGGVVYRPGKFGKAIQVAQACTNLCTNPSFETNTTGWTFTDANASGSASRTLYANYVGEWAMQLYNNNGGEDDFVYFNVTGLSASAMYTVSAYAYVTSEFVSGAFDNRGLFVYDTGNAGTAQTTTITAATTGWVRHVLNVTMSSTPGSLQVRLYAPRGRVYWDAVQVEGTGWCTPYADGSLGAGHAWAGTAHASTSSRTTSALSYPTSGNIIRPTGTVMAWVNPSSLVTGTSPTIFRATGTTGHIILRLDGTGKPQAYWGTAPIGSATAITANTWTHLAMTYNGATLTLYANGVLVMSAPTSGFDGMPVTMYVGNYAGVQFFDGLIDDLVILDRAASADEIRAVCESNAPIFAETSTWHWRGGRNRVYSDAEGLWMVGASGSAILGAYAGDDLNTSATKAWGGITMSEGDVVIGHNQSGSAAMFWDRSAGKFQFMGNGSATVQAEIATDGQISAGNGAIKLGRYGARLLTGSSRATYLDGTDGSRIMWFNSEILEAAQEAYNYLGFDYYRRSLIMRTVTDSSGSFSYTAHVELEAHDIDSPVRSASFILEAGRDIEDYGPAYGIDSLAMISADMVQMAVNRVRIEDDTNTTFVEIYQGNSGGSTPTLKLGQSDLSEEFIEFVGTVATGNAINTDALGSYYGRVRVSVNGTFKWLALYN